MAHICIQSTTVPQPGTTRRISLSIGDEVPQEVVDLMTEDHRSRCIGDGEPLPPEPPSDPEPGTSDDERLYGAPNQNATASHILAWVGDDPDRAEAAYERELRKTKPRVELRNRLTAIIDGDT